jgi:extracellular factor (EF) 3-hydroxypalmitic acid methyl ester biosynthesis protein
VYSQSQIDPLVSFRNAHGESVRGTLVSLQRKALVMEIYNPDFILQVSEVMHELTIRMGSKIAYCGNALVVSSVNTGLTAVVSLTLIDEWSELSVAALVPGAVGAEAASFVKGWTERYRIGRDYQAVVNEMRAFLSDVARWVDQVDLSDSLPKVDGMLREDLFYELAEPLMAKTQTYLERLEIEAARIEPELAPAHRAFAQSALHPLLLRAPFVFRTFTKPLGYAGDYMMVNQILGAPRQGPSTYFQIVNTAFLRTPVAAAHRNRIDILVAFLTGLADQARARGRPARILDIGCGPAAEIQRFLETYPEPHWLQFELLDFSEETLAWTRAQLEQRSAGAPQPVQIKYVQDSVHALLKKRPGAAPQEREFDAVYCAGLFDYLSDKVCARLMLHFASRIRPGGKLLVTNVHSDNPGKHGMEHLLEWHLIYRNEAGLEALLPPQSRERKLYVDATGVNVFAEMSIA